MWLRLRSVDEKKIDICLFLLLENSRPLSLPWEPWTPFSSSGTPDFLSTCLGIDFLNIKLKNFLPIKFSSVELLSHVWLFATPWTRPPCPSSTPGVYTHSCPLSQWCPPTISSSVVPFSSCLQFSPASGSFQKSQFLVSGGQSIGVSASASVLPMNIQDWFPLGWIGWIS